MKTYIQPGEVLQYTAPVGGVVAGNWYKIGSVIVRAETAAAAGAKFSAYLGSGVVELPKVAAEAWGEGAKVYFDSAAGLATTGAAAGANTLLGVSAASAANPTATGRVKLIGNVTA